MDYKKEYKAALERASIIYTGKYKPEIAAFCKQTLEAVFPELKNYSDIRIIKEITFFLKQKGGYNKDWINWLEKQGEKPQGKSALEASKEGKVDNANKVEPKFKVGDWVVFKNKHQSTYQVEKIEDGYYILRHTHGGTFRICVLHDESLRLWTIQDAKDGDVLVASDGSIFLFEGIYDCNCKHYVALTIDNVVAFNRNLVHCWETSTAVRPATKEQRELLLAKIKEAGYEWDVRNKRIIKL